MFLKIRKNYEDFKELDPTKEVLNNLDKLHEKLDENFQYRLRRDLSKLFYLYLDEYVLTEFETKPKD